MFALWSLAAVLAGQTEGVALTYAAARETARRHYPAVAAAQWEARAARVRTKPAGAWDDPMLGAQLWNMPLSHVEGALLPGMTTQQRVRTFAAGPDAFPFMVMMSQTFPWPGKRGARVDEQRALADAADARVEVTTADVDRAVAYAWADLSAANAARRNLTQTQSVLDALVELADGRLASGLGRPMDAISARSERDNQKQAFTDVEQQDAVARSRLAVLLGLSGPDALVVTSESVVARPVPSRAELLEAALKQRPELRAARAQVAAAVARARGERLGMLPDVTGNVAYMAQVGGADMLMTQGPYRALLGMPDMVTVGVSVPLPVFGPWKQLRNAEAADLDAKRASANVDAVIAVAQSEVDEALAGLAHARGHVTLHEETLIPLSERSVNAARQAYATGTGDLAGLLNAARMLRAHHLERISAQLSYARHLADLQRATGLDLVAFGDDGSVP